MNPVIYVWVTIVLIIILIAVMNLGKEKKKGHKGKDRTDDIIAVIRRTLRKIKIEVKL
jgi:hypothetical protein